MVSRLIGLANFVILRKSAYQRHLDVAAPILSALDFDQVIVTTDLDLCCLLCTVLTCADATTDAVTNRRLRRAVVIWDFETARNFRIIAQDLSMSTGRSTISNIDIPSHNSDANSFSPIYTLNIEEIRCEGRT
jgi:hypothetical protein